ncbi:MAG: hypothetical protein M3Y48_12595 [Actinomycetota bacterium]|nr:hypothetical protein [Actinomycetota bacterium]
MIIRILGDGQYEVDDSRVEELNTLDTRLLQAVDADDAETFSSALGEFLSAVEQLGKPLPDSALVPSELVLPARDADLGEVRAMLGNDGFIPG